MVLPSLSGVELLRRIDLFPYERSAPDLFLLLTRVYFETGPLLLVKSSQSFVMVLMVLLLGETGAVTISRLW